MRLETLRTPEDEPIPPNTLAALKRDLERHQIVKKQIREIEHRRSDTSSREGSACHGAAAGPRDRRRC